MGRSVLNDTERDQSTAVGSVTSHRALRKPYLDGLTCGAQESFQLGHLATRQPRVNLLRVAWVNPLACSLASAGWR